MHNSVGNFKVINCCKAITRSLTQEESSRNYHAGNTINIVAKPCYLARENPCRNALKSLEIEKVELHNQKGTVKMSVWNLCLIRTTTTTTKMTTIAKHFINSITKQGRLN